MALIQKERLYYMSPAANIVMEVVFRAPISVSALKSAIERAARRQATLSSRAVQSEGGEAELVPYEPASVCLTSFDGTDELRRALVEEAQTPLEPERGLWMRHRCGEAHGKPIWLICMHHVAGDGLSLLYFIRDTLLALRDNGLLWQTEAFRLCEPSKLEGRSPLPLRLMVNGIARSWEKEKRVFAPEDRRRVAQSYWAGRELCVMSRAVEGEALTRVLGECRANGVTLTAAVCAAMLMADGEAREVALAASIRPEGYEGSANWATGITVRLDKRQKPLWDMASDIKRNMDEKLGDTNKRNYLLHFLDLVPPALLDASYFAAFDKPRSKPASAMARLLGFTREPKGLSVTNLLRAPIDADEVAAIRFYPPLVPNVRRLVGMATVGDRLEITLQSFDAREECERYLSELVKLITEEL